MRRISGELLTQKNSNPPRWREVGVTAPPSLVQPSVLWWLVTETLQKGQKCFFSVQKISVDNLHQERAGLTAAVSFSSYEDASPRGFSKIQQKDYSSVKVSFTQT